MTPSRAVTLLAVVTVLAVVGCGRTITIDAPANVAHAMSGDVAGYALASAPAATWEDVKEGGVSLCGDDLGKVGSAFNRHMAVSVVFGITDEGCIRGAIEDMEQNSNRVLVTPSDLRFKGKSRMVRVVFK